MNERTFPKHPTRRQLLQVAASTTLSSLMLSGCGWTLANERPAVTVQGASNVLYIYTWASYTDRDLLKRFTQETGI
ncbi:MAG: spermidine/putrescine ABC transporter substrate-binding protein, partial [Symploca sp. SIO2E6]|nr:spermidine/putrescine ABC transporter substrate-binding protein [Symploca sp. SIO2E6]